MYCNILQYVVIYCTPMQEAIIIGGKINFQYECNIFLLRWAWADHPCLPQNCLSPTTMPHVCCQSCHHILSAAVASSPPQALLRVCSCRPLSWLIVTSTNCHTIIVIFFAIPLLPRSWFCHHYYRVTSLALAVLASPNVFFSILLSSLLWPNILLMLSPCQVVQIEQPPWCLAWGSASSSSFRCCHSLPL